MEYDAILFDIDGVLIDDSKSYWVAIEKTVNSFGVPCIQDDIKALKKIPGFNNDFDVCYAFVKNTKKIDQESEEYDTIKKRFKSFYNGENFDGLITQESLFITKETLEKLAEKHKLGVVTSRPRELALYGLRELIPEHIAEENIIAFEDCEVEKPDPRPILMLKERMNVENCL